MDEPRVIRYASAAAFTFELQVTSEIELEIKARE